MLKKLWRGDFPLWFNFWILGGIFGFLRFLFYYFEHQLTRSTAEYGIYPVSICDAISLVGLLIVWLVIWRSADHYEGAQYLAIGAKSGVILSILILFGIQYIT